VLLPVAGWPLVNKCYVCYFPWRGCKWCIKGVLRTYYNYNHSSQWAWYYKPTEGACTRKRRHHQLSKGIWYTNLTLTVGETKRFVEHQKQRMHFNKKYFKHKDRQTTSTIMHKNPTTIVHW